MDFDRDLIRRRRIHFPLWAQALYWALVAALYVWLLGPPASGLQGRPPAGREASELVVADSLLYDPERDWNGTVVSPRRFTVEVLAAVGFPLRDPTEEEVSLAYGADPGEAGHKK